MEINQQTTNEKFEKSTWIINDLSTLEYDEAYYFNSFTVDGYQWQISMARKEDPVDGFLINLQADDSANLPQAVGIIANIKLSIINQLVSTSTKTIEAQMQFVADDYQCFSWFMSSDALCDGFIEDDALIIVAELSVEESGHENQSDHEVGIIDSIKSGFQDFRGSGKIEKELVQLLEKACVEHPSLIECQKKRSRSFAQWALIALGRVLHFLKTKKVKDMNDDACKELQILWEELEAFGFDDLTWLEPHVQSALGLRNYIERAEQVEKLKEKVAALKIDLKTARIELFKAEKGFEERDLDDEVGY